MAENAALFLFSVQERMWAHFSSAAQFPLGFTFLTPPLWKMFFYNVSLSRFLESNEVVWLIYQLYWSHKKVEIYT